MKKTCPSLLQRLLVGTVSALLIQFASQAQVTVQSKGNVVVTSSTNAWSYLLVEGESYSSELNSNPGVGFVTVTNDGAITNIYGSRILASNTTASGKAALFTQSPLFGPHADKVTYQVQFASTGTYYLYMRFTMFENGGNLAHYISEDSFYVPPDFGKDPQTDWPLPNDGYTEGCCDTSGYLSIAEPGTDGVRISHRNQVD
ncbi:MAG: hypothetical protein ABIQ35_12170, partial [Verrucomicrobiota bacterium]